MKSALYKIRNYLVPSNSLSLYRQILISALDNGYKILNMVDFVDSFDNYEADKLHPFLILRHDVDVDKNGAIKLCEIETNLGIRSSYYFRLRTWDDKIVSTIAKYNHEIGYHNEEVADFIKSNRIYHKDEVFLKIKQIQEHFEENITRLRCQSGLKLEGVASHGDFVNRSLNLANFVILEDPDFRQRLKIRYEAYDHQLLRNIPNYISDKQYPLCFSIHPLDLIEKNESFLLLTHPRHWNVSLKASIKADLQDFIMKYKWQNNSSSLQQTNYDE